MRIVLTGATGYIGRSLIPYLVKAGHSIACLCRNKSDTICDGIEIRGGPLFDESFLRDAVSDADTVFHLAGYKGYDHCEQNTGLAILHNITFTEHLIRALSFSKGRCIFTSTYWVYGHRAPVPYREDDILSPCESYGWTKALAERLIFDSGLDFCILRLSNVFGFGSGTGYQEVASLFLRNALQGKAITLHNQGKHLIDLISIDDVCRVFLRLLEKRETNLVMNLGSGYPTSLFDLATICNKIAEKMTNRKAEILLQETVTDDAAYADRFVDISRLRDSLGFTPNNLQDSLTTLAWQLLEKREI